MSRTKYRPRRYNRYHDEKYSGRLRLAATRVAMAEMTPAIGQREFWDTAVWCEDGAARPGMALRLDYTLDRVPALWEALAIRKRTRWRKHRSRTDKFFNSLKGRRQHIDPREVFRDDALTEPAPPNDPPT